MALDDVKHVEAVAMLNAVLESPSASTGMSLELKRGIEGWLEENHPPPSAYSAAMHSLVPPTPDDHPTER